jgi:hypothetical protein
MPRLYWGVDAIQSNMGQEQRMNIPRRNQEILKQVQDDSRWTFYMGWTSYRQ